MPVFVAPKTPSGKTGQQVEDVDIEDLISSAQLLYPDKPWPASPEEQSTSHDVVRQELPSQLIELCASLGSRRWSGQAITSRHCSAVTAGAWTVWTSLTFPARHSLLLL